MTPKAAASDVLKKLVELFGVSWAKRFVVPKVLRLARTTNYLHRMTFLMCVNRWVRPIINTSTWNLPGSVISSAEVDVK